MRGATIRIFLIDGTPLGPRTIEKSNWTGKALDFARGDWPRLKARTESSRPGAYVVWGTDDTGNERLYVGEADELQRAALIENGVLQATTDRYRFTQDHTFESPSTAAGVVLGRSSNGREAWKDPAGRSLKEIQKAALQEP